VSHFLISANILLAHIFFHIDWNKFLGLLTGQTQYSVNSPFQNPY